MRIESRLKRIEKKPETDNTPCLRFPLPEGGFIEAPGCRTLLDVLALADSVKHEQTMDETERK